MKVILRADITNVGKQGQIKEVSAGFARNFLLPKKIAMEATPQNLKIWEREKVKLEKQREEIIAATKEVAEKLSKATFSTKVKVGENGKIFGSITTATLSKIFAEQGFSINKHDILLPAPVKEVCKLSVNVRLHPEVIAKVEVDITEDKSKN